MFLPLLCLVAAITLPPPSSTNFADGAGLLTDGERATVVEQLQTIEKARSVKVGVLTIDQLDDDPKAVSVRTLNYWQMGPDSVLVLISLQPRKIYLQPGTNLSYLFDTRNSSTITNSMVPFLKKKDTLGALLQALGMIDSTLKTVGVQAIVPTSKPAPSDLPQTTRAVPIQTTNRYTDSATAGMSGLMLGTLIFFLAAGAILVIGLAMARSKKRRYEALDIETGYAPLRRPSTFVPPPSIAPSYYVESPVPAPKRQYSPPPVAPVVQQTVVVDSGGDNLATGILIGQALERSAPPPPPPAYVPPPSPPRRSIPAPRYSPPAPRYSPPSYSGGGSSDWGSSSDSGSSDGGGGGGSDW